MRGFLKFLVLVALLVPAWILVLTLTGEDRLKQQATMGPLVVVDEALGGAGDERWVATTIGMEPTSLDDGWRLEGLTAVPGGTDADAEMPQHFVAALHTKCQPLAEADCWVLDRLDLDKAEAPASDQTEAPAQPEGLAEAQRLQLAQEQLRKMGFEPGPSDGNLGPQTRQAIKDYVARTNGLKVDAKGSTAELTDEAMSKAVTELSAMGLLARGQQHHAQGDFHAALQVYDEVLRRDPENAQAWFSRGLIYQDMGVRDLAIADYDTALKLSDKHFMAYHSRGNVHFEKGDHWRAFADHADGFGVRYMGDGYLAFTESMGAAWTQVEPQVAAMMQWAQGAWQQGKATLEESLSAKDGAAAKEERS